MLENRFMNPFTQAKYLSEQNYKRYTAIVNYLYLQHEVYYAPPSLPMDILDYIRENDRLGMFDDYDISKLESDLVSLEEWGNVISHPDTGHVTRIEDFNQRKLRYQCTDETIAIERLMEQINSKMNIVKGSLDPSLVGSLSTLLLDLEEFKNKNTINDEERNNISALWKDIFAKFETLRRETSDYLGVIHSKNIEDAMQNKEISAFRLKFTNYLTDFIVSIQKNVNVIEDIIKQLSHSSFLEVIINEMIITQKNKPTLEEEVSDDDYHEVFSNQWEGLKKWFVRDEFNERYVDYLLKQTSDTISRFTKYLQQLSERELQAKNRKKQYLHLADIFEKESDFSLCQKSFGAMTNIEKPMHFFSMNRKEIVSETTLYEHEPEMHSLKEAKERKKQERKKMATIEISEEDLRIQKELKKQKEKEEQEILSLVRQREVKLKELKNVESFKRNAILNWISQSGEEQKGKTEHGLRYEIKTVSNEWIVLDCVDGKLRMPDYVLSFEV